MREIKFRAWDTVSKAMFQNDEIRTEAFEVYSLKDEEWFYGKSEDITLMQYTGLKDKNGVEIYEGDIVKYILTERFDEVDEIIDSVEFRGGAFYPIPVDDECDDGWYSRIISDYEVIGNIYENKELLEAP